MDSGRRRGAIWAAEERACRSLYMANAGNLEQKEDEEEEEELKEVDAEGACPGEAAQQTQ